jgi:hypothetical protein
VGAVACVRERETMYETLYEKSKQGSQRCARVFVWRCVLVCDRHTKSGVHVQRVCA